MKNGLKKTLVVLVALATFSASLPVRAAALEERIPSPDQIKYFKVTKKEGGSLYGIRISFPKTVGSVSSGAYMQVIYDQKAFASPAVFSVATSTVAENLPWEYKAITPTFNYSLVSAGLHDPAFPIEARIYYKSDDAGLKRIFSYDAPSKTWLSLPFSENISAGYLAVKIESLSGKLIVMSETGKMSLGKASWYKYKNGFFAASPDYEKGSILRVYNTKNGKYVDVTVNDYGPDRAKHPDRVVDLDLVAFKKIASPADGIISVRVEPIKAVESPIKKSIPKNAVTPVISASSAVLMLEKDSNLLFSKDADAVMPIASLSKLIFAKVFLSLEPDFDKVVTYKYQDEKYNYEYCEPWQSSRLKVKEGETMTVRDLFYSAIIGSANNAVESLVRVSGLSRKDFVARMNSFAKEIGARNTKFVEPTGLSPQNVSSASDYAIMAKEALSDPVLKKVSATAKYSFKTINTKEEHNLKNTNQLISSSGYNISGSKTGYLDEAGYCLMTAVESPIGNMIVVNLNSKSRAENFNDNEQLIKYGLKLLGK